jgi:O-glycosyl hydrolase
MIITAFISNTIIGKGRVNNAMTTEITISPQKKYQKIDGFGVSGAWWAQDVGGWSNLGEILDYLFDKEKGIGLTIYRYNVGAGPKYNNVNDPWRRTECFEVAPGKYDWSRDKNAQKALFEAVKRGVDTVVLFANSPPGRMTKNGYTSGDFLGGSNFKSGMEKEFAKFLCDVAEYFTKKGVPVKYISPINEPQWNWKENQEGCHYTVEEAYRVAKALVAEIKRRKLKVKPSFIESGKWYDPDYTFRMYELLTNDREIREMMDHFAVHSYWSDEFDKKMAKDFFDKTKYKLPLHMSEWCQMESGRDLGMEGALKLAKTIHEDLTILSVSSWQHWLAVSCYDYNDGLIYVDKNTHKYYVAKRLWAFGNWSRYVRPGYTRIEAKSESDNNDLFVSSFISPDGKKIVTVIVNQANERKEIRFSGISYKTVEVIETSEKNSLKTIYKGAKQDFYRLNPNSITTFVTS